MEQTNSAFLSCILSTSAVLCFILFFMNSLELITAAKGDPSFILTNETDHQALLAIRDLIPGDPLSVFRSWNNSIHFCNWQGVSCGRQHQRVTSLNLSSLALMGFVSPHIGNLTFLRTIDLGNNSFNGEIPPEIGRLFRLQYLFLNNNSFKGEFPASLTRCSDLRIIYVINNNLGGKIPAGLGSLSKLFYLNFAINNLSGTIPQSIGNLSSLRALSLTRNNLDGSIPIELGQLSKLEFLQLSGNNLSAILYRNRRSRKRVNLASPLKNQYPQLSYGELFQATNGFSPSNLIGEGGYGYVYKGILNSDEQIVAVKVLNLYECGANKSFVTECEALKNIRHRNLVKIITSCSSIDFRGNDFKALVFEFMENGSLESWLHSSLSKQQEPKNLNFVQRLNIAIDVASAIDYLHNHCEMTFIHCDLKPSNILLDGDLCAHVSDFGLAKIFSATTGISNHQQSSSIGIRGTIGYVAPEYGMGEEVSTQGDMYSYGVLLLEMFTGKRPTNNMFTGNVNLHGYVKMCLPQQVMQIVDPQIILEMEEEPSKPSRSKQCSTTNISKLETCLVPVFQIGVSCSVEMPNERMSVKEVIKELHKIRNVFLGVRGKRH
ncbi:hypothetical protein CsSME_00044465 [Camellia sinensis var. sinensis]